MAAGVLHKKFTVAQYYRMSEAGILTPRDRVELIEGEIVEMSPIGTRHAVCVNRLARILFASLSDEITISVQNPVRLNNFSEPEPDFALLKGQPEDYSGRHPGPEDIFTLIEVSDSTLEYDRARKATLYAREGIRELWIVDLGASALEVYRSPSPEGYRQVRVLQRSQSVALEACPETAIAIAQIF